MYVLTLQNQVNHGSNLCWGTIKTLLLKVMSKNTLSGVNDALIYHKLGAIVTYCFNDTTVECYTLITWHF